MKLRYFITGLLLCCLVPLSLNAQSQGPNGFDWIGPNPANVHLQRCFDAHLTPPGGFSRPLTTWVPPEYAGSTAEYFYTPQEFRAVVGVYNSALNPQHPSATISWELFVYDSFERFRENANLNFRARYTFNLGSASAQYGDFVQCQLYNLGFFFNIPCHHLTLNLQAPSLVEYRTAAGEVTTTPPEIRGGKKYYFSLVGWAHDIDNPCVIRTNSGLALSISEIHAQMPMIDMNDPQCAEASMAPGCSVPVATFDFLKMTPSFGCNVNRSFVNPSDPHYPAPRFVNVFDGSVPLSCGGGNQQPCCERSMKSRWAYGLTTTRVLRKITQPWAITAARMPYCQNC